MATDRRFPGVSLRELREEDADEVAELFRVVFGDERPIDAEQVVSWVRNEELDAAWLRVLELDGRIVGYGDIQVIEDEVAVDVAAPIHWETLFEWAEESARAYGARQVSVRSHSSALRLKIFMPQPSSPIRLLPHCG
jgi:hypothetical protein